MLIIGMGLTLPVCGGVFSSPMVLKSRLGQVAFSSRPRPQGRGCAPDTRSIDADGGFPSF